jgi:hypothetical protein
MQILNIFCSPAPPSGVVVATTKWSNSSTEDETNRQTELRSKNLNVVQFTREQDSAWHIIDRIIQQEALDVKALVERLKGYSQTRRGVTGAIFARFRKMLLVTMISLTIYQHHGLPITPLENH